VGTVVSRVPDAGVMADLDAAAAWASATGFTDPERLGITGFCWGGRITWLYAAHNPQLRAGVAWYGRLVGQASELQPRHPIDLVGEIATPILGLYGEADQGIPVSTVHDMEAAAKAAGKPVEFEVYPEAPHAFFADYRPSYRKDTAQAAWTRCLDWLGRYL
jgi:carboxymethylenebutenolidase